ncbi:MAG: hypothetical protein ACFFG0_18650, partial [Candidatus Thorarchaeota archaeon]
KVKNPPNKNQWINNRISKYLEVELFRSVGKAGKSYAGFNNIVHLSSGIVRQFLDICSFLYDLQNKEKDGIDYISIEKQKKGIKDYADHFLERNVRSYYLEASYSEGLEDIKKYNDLYNLIEILGNFYRKRLLESDKADARLFSFTLKDPQNEPYFVKLLNLGITCNCFHDYWYSTKKGIGRIKVYAFNRILCVRYSLDPTSFRGRIELTVAQLKNALKKGELLMNDLKLEKEHITLDKYREI